LESDCLPVVKQISINKDMQLLKVIAYKERYIWLASVYLTRGTGKQIQALFEKIQRVLHPVEVNNLLLIGD
jgi:hypothetical protein